MPLLLSAGASSSEELEDEESESDSEPELDESELEELDESESDELSEEDESSARHNSACVAVHMSPFCKCAITYKACIVNTQRSWTTRHKHGWLATCKFAKAPVLVNLSLESFEMLTAGTFNNLTATCIWRQ